MPPAVLVDPTDALAAMQHTQDLTLVVLVVLAVILALTLGVLIVRLVR